MDLPTTDWAYDLKSSKHQQQLVVIGEPSVGKSALVQRLLNLSLGVPKTSSNFATQCVTRYTLCLDTTLPENQFTATIVIENSYGKVCQEFALTHQQHALFLSEKQLSQAYQEFLSKKLTLEAEDLFPNTKLFNGTLQVKIMYHCAKCRPLSVIDVPGYKTCDAYPFSVADASHKLFMRCLKKYSQLDDTLFLVCFDGSTDYRKRSFPKEMQTMLEFETQFQEKAVGVVTKGDKSIQTLLYTEEFVSNRVIRNWKSGAFFAVLHPSSSSSSSSNSEEVDDDDEEEHPMDINQWETQVWNDKLNGMTILQSHKSKLGFAKLEAYLMQHHLESITKSVNAIKEAVNNQYTKLQQQKQTYWLYDPHNEQERNQLFYQVWTTIVAILQKRSSSVVVLKQEYEPFQWIDWYYEFPLQMNNTIVNWREAIASGFFEKWDTIVNQLLCDVLQQTELRMNELHHSLHQVLVTHWQWDLTSSQPQGQESFAIQDYIQQDKIKQALMAKEWSQAVQQLLLPTNHTTTTTTTTTTLQTELYALFHYSTTYQLFITELDKQQQVVTHWMDRCDTCIQAMHTAILTMVQSELCDTSHDTEMTEVVANPMNKMHIFHVLEIINSKMRWFTDIHEPLVNVLLGLEGEERVKLEQVYRNHFFDGHQFTSEPKCVDFKNDIYALVQEFL